MKTLYIRTEANVVTAMGHMARCMTIADAVKKLGGKAVFVVAEEESAVHPKARGHEVICLNRQWDDFDGEIPVMQKLISEQGIESLLVDSYFITEEYMKALNEVTYLSYIDDLYERVWPVSCVINYASYASTFPYDKDYPNAKRFLGPSFFPLREEFCNVKRRTVPATVKRILVVTGGSDEYHFMNAFFDKVVKCDELKSVEFHFVCGNFNRDLDLLREKSLDTENVIIMNTLPSLKSEMEEADIIVTAGGTTLYEAASTGLPIICFSFVDNQLFNVKSFSNGGYGIYAGDLREHFDYDKLVSEIIALSRDVNKRKDMSDKLYQLVDGKGAERLATEFMA